ncbi:tRNA (cytidine/uridine-2'-O-)-methyltransferase TrmJ [Betaproteobacteria bacterium]|nr:tRNA (cytidine/uridine-2'-O-)-methyltransferase TrmJ [Betaproteobacteria bacterium]GHT99365.1 tRNA (cytidine/uridine-2'-O-)-methyltransferase TrmJ [Betaproteobacteria bacterium]GHT99980.1 tRNA (cytidine/uridine-2'-O-)-methyltransferase TrmJ [Betaproteobacteria bacterium]GHU14540.1 tRNA (cytidine/uridine-2'-O-)-methyltransferase TrmJ [Betaproteobacteria bacterium]GHU22869.1 tRNA (cytidine/uridine-2'-O-)-methyltransferase TrmJ [Betaproteobacteria bacterium]
MKAAETVDSNMNGQLTLDRVRIVLSRTSHPGNIGATARAMKTMGLSRLWLVAPASFPDPVADARASGAGDVLAGAQVVATLEEALAGTVFVAALSARRRELSLPRLQPRDAVSELVAWSEKGDVALVFGNEASGLTNAELGLCSRPVTIPTSPDYSSLNLAAAVQVLCYELRLAALGSPGRGAESAVLPQGSHVPAPATHDEVEGFYAHLETAIIASGFLDPENPRRLLPRMRRLFGRARLEKEEVAILRGILASFIDNK